MVNPIDCQSLKMGSHLADTQSCYQQRNPEILTKSPEISEPKEAGITKQSIKLDDPETIQDCQQQIVPPENTDHQTNTPTSPLSPKIESIPLQNQDSDTESLIHFYSCCKLSFMIKMASLQSVKTLGYALSEEDIKKEEETMEEARTKALEAWQKIRDRGLSYDVIGSEYLRSCTLH